MPTIFEARFHGTCDECHESITPGQQIRYRQGEDASVMHAECPDLPTDDDPSKACKTCHLIHPPGDCE